MTFLNPALLIGLFAVAIPILIHLLNLRKIRKIEFSTLMFLKEIQKSKIRKIKLKQLLLLLLRILAVIFLVLGFSNPVIEDFNGTDDNTSSTAVIILDNSFSMTARDNNGLYSAQAKDAVKKIVENLKESDNIYFIPSSEIDFKNKKALFENSDELKDSLEKIKTSYKCADINQIMNYASEIFNNSKSRNNELYLISDFQKNNFKTNESAQEYFKDLVKTPVNIFLVKTGNRQVNNLSLDSLNVVTKIIEKNKATKIKIFLNNHSQYNVTNKKINLYIDNALVSEKATDAVSFSKKEIEFDFKPIKTGYLSGMLELVQSEFEDDEIIQDNKYFFTIYIPDKFNIGLLENPAGDYKFIDLAIRSASELLSDSIGSKSELFNINLFNSFDNDIFNNNIIFISGKNNFTENDAVILKNYISEGGGVFFFPGSEADINNYNNTIFSKINSCRFEKLNIDENINSSLKFEKINFDNPLLSEIFSNKKLNETFDRFNIESPKVKFYYDVINDESFSSVISFSNNKPFISESKISGGKIIVSSLPLSKNYSDLTAKSIFLPLIIRSIYYLSNNFNYQSEYIVGNSNLITLNKSGSINKIVMPDKNNITELTDNKYPGSNYYFLPYSAVTSQTGIYELVDSSGGENLFAMNFNPEESNPDFYQQNELKEFFKSPGIKNIKFVESNDNIVSEIKSSGSGLALWKYFLIGALIFILLEMLLSKKIEKG